MNPIEPKIAEKYDGNGEVTVVWKAALCQHAGGYVRGLPSVFKPNGHPWIDVKAATTEQIFATVQAYPAGALTFLAKAVN